MPKSSPHKLRSLLLRKFILLFFIPTAALLTIIIGRLHAERLREQSQFGVQHATVEAARVERAVEGAMVELLALALMPEVANTLIAQNEEERRLAALAFADRLEAYLLREAKYVVGFHVFDAAGQPVAEWGTPIHDRTANHIAGAPFFVGAMNLAAIRGTRAPVHITQDGPDEPVIFSTLMLDAGGRIAGVAALATDFRPLFQEMHQVDGEHRLIGLIDASGRPMQEAILGSAARNLPESVRANILARPRGIASAPRPPEYRMVSFARIQPTGQPAIRWTALFEVSLKPMVRAYRRSLTSLFLGTALLALIAVILANIYSQRLSLLAAQLAAAADRLREGDWDVPLPDIQGPDEMLRLAQSFQRLRDQLRESYRALAIEKEQLAVILRSIEYAVIATDLEGRVRFVNRATEKLLNCSSRDLLGKPLADLFRCFAQDLTKPLPLMEWALAPGTRLPEDVQLVRPDGSQCTVELQISTLFNPLSERIGAIFLLLDVTHHRLLEKERIQQDRIRSLGVLAGGLAHDFNNLLAVIMGNLSLALDLAPAQECGECRQFMESALAAVERARALTSQLLVFAKGGAIVKRSASLREIVSSTLEFVTHGTSCLWQIHAPPDLWPVLADTDQLHQVFHNLALNSIQAMGGVGKIEVVLENCQVPEQAPEAVGLMSGRYVRVRFRDYGPGIAPENLCHIFEPYFTTKPNGHGLGLSMVHGIISGHGGLVEAHPANPGVTFVLYLPAAADVAAVSESPKNQVEAPKALRVLLLEDDPYLRDLVRRMLERLGHEVETAEEGEKAIRLFDEAVTRGSPFHVVIADLTIRGGLGGVETIRELRARFPRFRAIAASGYSLDPVLENPSAYGFNVAIRKPFELDRLRAALAEAFRSGAVT